MKYKCLAISLLISLPAVSSAQTTPDAQCKSSVESTLAAIETLSKLKGSKQRLKDLSADDIKKTQQARGSCAAMQEINKRTLNS